MIDTRIADDLVQGIPTPLAPDEAELARTAAAAFSRALSDGEIDGYLALLDPEVDFETASATRGRVALRGHAALRSYLEQASGEYDELRLTPGEIRGLGPGSVLVLGRWSGRLRGGTRFGAPLATILTIADGRVTRLRGYMDEQQALDAVEERG